MKTLQTPLQPGVPECFAMIVHILVLSEESDDEKTPTTSHLAG